MSVCVVVCLCVCWREMKKQNLCVYMCVHNVCVRMFVCVCVRESVWCVLCVSERKVVCV